MAVATFSGAVEFVSSFFPAFGGSGKYYVYFHAASAPFVTPVVGSPAVMYTVWSGAVAAFGTWGVDGYIAASDIAFSGTGTTVWVPLGEKQLVSANGKKYSLLMHYTLSLAEVPTSAQETILLKPPIDVGLYEARVYGLAGGSGWGLATVGDTSLTPTWVGGALNEEDEAATLVSTAGAYAFVGTFGVQPSYVGPNGLHASGFRTGGLWTPGNNAADVQTVSNYDGGSALYAEGMFFLSTGSDAITEKVLRVSNGNLITRFVPGPAFTPGVLSSDSGHVSTKLRVQDLPYFVNRKSLR